MGQRCPNEAAVFEELVALRIGPADDPSAAALGTLGLG